MTLALAILHAVGCIVGPALLVLAAALLVVGLCRNSGKFSRLEEEADLRRRWGGR